MRQILFRGKSIASGEWEYGYYCYSQLNEHPCIQNPDTTQAKLIVPSTLGEWAGLSDKNGVKIFEGDIVKKRVRNGHIENRIVSFSNGCFNCGYRYSGSPYSLEDSNIEVVGNMWDNPELVYE